MRIECKHCGGSHPAWDCKSVAKKSTERKNGPKPAPARRGVEPEDGASSVPAPVDTHSEPPAMNRADPPRSGAATRKDAGPAAPKPRKKTGRPQIHPDRKAYKAMKERDRRARIKAGQASHLPIARDHMPTATEGKSDE